MSQRLRERRRSLGLTQKQVVSRLARLGLRLANKTLSSLEHGAGIDVASFAELASALECSVTWLLGLTDEPHRWTPERRIPSGASARSHRAAPSPPTARAVLGPPAPTPDPVQPPGAWVLAPWGTE